MENGHQTICLKKIRYTPEKNRCHVTPLPPYNGQLYTANSFLVAKEAVIERLDCRHNPQL